MAEPFLGQICIFGFNFAPNGWAFCQGQLMPIAQNTALFSLLGTQYGGNGQTTFALPDLRGRVPLGFGQGPGLSPYTIGEQAGVEAVTLVQGQMPQHSHLVSANGNPGPEAGPINNFPAADGGGVTTEYATSASGTMNPGMIQPAG